MQHPVGYAMRDAGGRMDLVDIWGLLFNPWGIWQYLHVMCGAVITGAFVVAAVAAYWVLMRQYEGDATFADHVGSSTARQVHDDIEHTLRPGRESTRRW
jgi:cytochrome d ubiquinol oxidase subunit I